MFQGTFFFIGSNFTNGKIRRSGQNGCVSEENLMFCIIMIYFRRSVLKQGWCSDGRVLIDLPVSPQEQEMLYADKLSFGEGIIGGML